ncbi:MAG: hypothetical protein B7Y25_06175 [Alphaproteobacteria bacterium 16-39-46]|nr:MAG: hypothetical protein B7Y25_06175 [Alphaproteobacteria bacterium 16-39-46]OZA42370.1 MAG: hypothetical protein B7X84_06285 [Alphaproteobacteria bacterium 17-39-52]HQS84500.1 Npt1/Npt2 family nucleotide transporter [Alphaproteobacteria bacterium]HQS94289.1 Npt1/Npt2 family nucleotide transporter [Alphaproteobacteria bacterium]
MTFQEKILSLGMRVCRFNFGTFETEEFKKFLRMGLIFSVIVGVYWTLRSLKDSIFIQLVDKMDLPLAKTVSVLALLPLVMIYTKLLENWTREKMFILLPTFYGFGILGFSVLISVAQIPVGQIEALSTIPFIATKLLGYSWYLFVESFGSLIVSLFWAFATDTTDPSSAKRGFPFIVALGQIGGIICPYGIGGLPHRLGLLTDTLSMVILGLLTLMLIPLIRYFLKATPRYLLRSFHGKNDKKEEIKHTSGFLEGLKLILKNRYLLSIFAVNFIYEFIVTIVDFNFKLAAGTAYTGVALSHYLSFYGSTVNSVSFLCLILGISNITRFLGVGMALMIMPLIVGLALFGFLTIDALFFLFILMVGSKAINYSLNGPTLKQLYIPTTTDVRFKAQAWIETFGSRSSKEVGSLFNMTLRPLQSVLGGVAGHASYLTLTGVIGGPLILLWFVVAFYLGRNFRKAIDQKKVVC